MQNPRMKLKMETIYKISLVILFLLPFMVISVELNLLLGLIFIIPIIIDFRIKFSSTLFLIIFPLVLILCIALISGIFYKTLIINTIKDFFYLSKPVLYIIIGYFLVDKIKDKAIIFKIIIYVALVFAILHLYNVMAYLNDQKFNINQLRNFTGRGNSLEMFAVLLLLSKKGKSLFFINSNYIKIIKLIIICSFIFYFSRTLTISLIILLMSINGYLKITSKGLIYMASFIAFTLLFYAYLFSIELDRKANGVEGFFYKMKMAPSEIFYSQEIEVTDHEKLWDHWRAYEAQKAFEQLESTPNRIGLLFGKGLGSLVDLGFVAPLNDEGMQYISTLHNGYAFIFFKSGFLGIFIYITFLLNIYLQGNKASNNIKQKVINNLLSGLAITILFTTLIVSGIYNPNVVSDAIILGALLSLGHYYSKSLTPQTMPSF